MFGLTSKLTKKAGLPPGTLVHVGEQKVEATRIRVIDYDDQNISETDIESLEDVQPFVGKPSVTWIDIVGLHETEMLADLGEAFDIHTLVMEDVVNTHQRPKFEEFKDHLFIVIKAFLCDQGNDEIVSEQISLILGTNFVISFQESETNVFQPVLTRIKNARGRIRTSGPDYLAYALMDTVVDNYFAVIDMVQEKIEVLDEKIPIETTNETLQEIYAVKRDVLNLRKSIWPLREVIAGIERSETELIEKTTDIFIRDIYDHTIQIVESIDSYREMIGGLIDLYMSSVSNKMNEVMKVLTIIATIFIPLSFLAGVYGMNFDYMPELKWHWSYFIFWGIIVTAAVSMLVYFKRRRWL